MSEVTDVEIAQWGATALGYHVVEKSELDARIAKADEEAASVDAVAEPVVETNAPDALGDDIVEDDDGAPLPVADEEAEVAKRDAPPAAPAPAAPAADATPAAPPRESDPDRWGATPPPTGNNLPVGHPLSTPEKPVAKSEDEPVVEAPAEVVAQ